MKASALCVFLKLLTKTDMAIWQHLLVPEYRVWVWKLKEHLLFIYLYDYYFSSSSNNCLFPVLNEKLSELVFILCTDDEDFIFNRGYQTLIITYLLRHSRCGFIEVIPVKRMSHSSAQDLYMKRYAATSVGSTVILWNQISYPDLEDSFFWRQ